MTAEENPGGKDSGTERDGQTKARNSVKSNAEIFKSKANKGKEIDLGKYANRPTINKKNSRGDLDNVLMDISPNTLAPKARTWKAQVDSMSLSAPETPRMIMGLDKENHSVYVPKTYDTVGPSNMSKTMVERPDKASALHRTGKSSGRPPDKRNAIVLRSRRSGTKPKIKSPLSQKKKGIPSDIFDELELGRLLEVEAGNGVVEEEEMEEAEGNTHSL